MVGYLILNQKGLDCINLPLEKGRFLPYCDGQEAIFAFPCK